MEMEIKKDDRGRLTTDDWRTEENTPALKSKSLLFKSAWVSKFVVE